jgi:MYXO-CTERM domain-containing protein
MPNVRVWSSVACVALVGCLESASEPPEVGVTSQALDACSETVPANRNVDGVPAYSQCSASNDSAIYSNNGVDTSLTQVDKTWVKTQYSGGYQCTELAHRYLYFRWNVKWIPNGNAGNWCDTQPPASSGVVQTMTPMHGDIMVLAPGSCGASPDTGHVNVVDTVDMASAKVTAVEQNVAGRHPYNMSCAKCFLHVMMNDGVAKPISGAAATPPAAAGSGAPPVTMPTVPPPPPASDPSAAGRPAFPTTAPGGGLPVTPPAAAVPPPPAATPTTTSKPASGAAGAPVMRPNVVTVDDQPAAAGGAAVPSRGSERAPSDQSAGCSVASPRGGAGGAPWFLMLAGLAIVVARRRR